MNKFDPKVIAIGVAAALAFAVFVFFQAISGSDDEPEDNAAGPGPVATLAPAPGDDVEPVPEETTEPAKSDLAVDVEAAQIESAEQFISNYYAYSWRDKTPNDFLNRAKPLMTTQFWDSTRDAFKDSDPDTSVEWSKIRNERRTVSVLDVAGEVDPWYDATAKRSVIAVEFSQATEDAIGTGGVGDPQTERLVIVEVDGKYLVDDIVVTGTDGT